MNFNIKDLIQQFKTSFPKAQSQIEAQISESEIHDPDQNYTSLSSEEFASYQSKIKTLLLPEDYKNFIQTKLCEVLNRWKNDKSLANYIFILASPIESTNEILKKALESVQDQDLSLNFLEGKTRPDEHSMLKIKLQSQIETLVNKSNINSQSLVIIPDLSLYFLRCVEGLDAVEYICDLILKDHSRFWVVGCNQWAWNYFDYVYQVNTCFEHIFPLPKLSAIQLKQWLTPIYETLNVEFGDHKNDSDNHVNEWQDEDRNWISKEEEKYFKCLAKISEGLSQTAAHLWLDSLQSVKPPEKSDAETLEIQEDKLEKNFILKRPSFPHLPELTKEDQYLLFSIGLHEEISISALSVSLGDPEIQIRIQVERLLRLGIIRRQKELLQLSPSHYYRLKRDLISHHILTEERD